MRRMQIIGEEFPLPLVDPAVIFKIDAVCVAIEAEVVAGIRAAEAELQPPPPAAPTDAGDAGDARA